MVCLRPEQRLLVLSNIEDFRFEKKSSHLEEPILHVCGDNIITKIDVIHC